MSESERGTAGFGSSDVKHWFYFIVYFNKCKLKRLAFFCCFFIFN
jgi:hypothetical protein